MNISASDVSVALDRANARMRRVLAALAAEGVARKDVQTAGLSIRPVYDYNDSGPPLITGYAVSEDADVLVRSLGDSGSVIAAAAGAGGNAVRLHGVRLKIGDEDALMRKARDSAVAKATAKARQYAEATGQVLGEVLSIREVTARASGAVPVYAQRAVLDATAVSKVPIRAGSATTAITVAVTWSLR